MRYIIPERLTRDQAATFRPSDLPIGQSSRKSSAHSDGIANHSYLNGGQTKSMGYGPPVTTQFLSMTESKLGIQVPKRSVASSPKNNATDSSQELSYVSGGGNKYTTQKTLVSSNEKILFAENGGGVPIAYRSNEERSSNPDRLNLDRRGLTVCPLLEGEELLRLLNLQHNLITRVENITNLKRLIFLDLYDNRIDNMSGLSDLRSLRVLMLGKNRIEKITGLSKLVKLDVLDLHGNQISKVENLNQLNELRVLNLAGNQLQCVSNLAGMDTLAELNLRRNNISTVVEIDLLPNLLRLFLSFNDVSSWSDVECLGESTSLLEVTLDGNPITNEATYKQTVVKNMTQLRQLDMKRISDEERRVAALLLKKEEDRKREAQRQSLVKEKKKLAVSNAAMRWRAEFPFNDSEKTDVVSVHNDFKGASSSWLSTLSTWVIRNCKNSNSLPINSLSLTSLEVSQSYLAEIEADVLYLFGPKALESLDRSWGNSATTVHTLAVQFIYFDDLSPCFDKLRQRFPALQNVVLRECGISELHQLNSLARLTKLASLTIECGAANPLTQLSLWKFYVLYRLSHLSIATLNGYAVTPSDVNKAEQIFGCLSLATSTQLSHYRLSALHNNSAANHQQTTTGGGKESKKKQSSNKEGCSELDLFSASSSAESAVKSAFQHCSGRQVLVEKLENQLRHSVARQFVDEVCGEACDVLSKRHHFHNCWPRIFVEMVADTCVQMNDVEAYVRAEAERFYLSES